MDFFIFRKLLIFDENVSLPTPLEVTLVFFKVTQLFFMTRFLLGVTRTFLIVTSMFFFKMTRLFYLLHSFFWNVSFLFLTKLSGRFENKCTSQVKKSSHLKNGSLLRKPSHDYKWIKTARVSGKMVSRTQIKSRVTIKKVRSLLKRSGNN